MPVGIYVDEIKYLKITTKSIGVNYAPLQTTNINTTKYITANTIAPIPAIPHLKLLFLRVKIPQGIAVNQNR